MSVKCEEYSQVCVIEIQGDFLADSAAEAKKALEHHIDQRQIVDFVVDFAEMRVRRQRRARSPALDETPLRRPVRPVEARQPRRKLQENSGNHPARSSLRMPGRSPDRPENHAIEQS